MPHGKAVQRGAMESPCWHETVHEGHEAAVVSGFQEVGGFLIFGIPILSVEHDPLKLFGQAAGFFFLRAMVTLYVSGREFRIT